VFPRDRGKTNGDESITDRSNHRAVLGRRVEWRRRRADHVHDRDHGTPNACHGRVRTETSARSNGVVGDRSDDGRRRRPIRYLGKLDSAFRKPRPSEGQSKRTDEFLLDRSVREPGTAQEMQRSKFISFDLEHERALAVDLFAIGPIDENSGSENVAPPAANIATQVSHDERCRSARSRLSDCILELELVEAACGLRDWREVGPTRGARAFRH
jgi:hypothetical protein